MTPLSEKMRLISKNIACLMLITPALITLGACHAVPKLPQMPRGEYKQSVRNIPYAAATPMRDLNIGNKPIPDQLATLQNPYGTDTHRSCAAILAELRALDEALQRNQRNNPGTIHRSDTRAGNIGNALDVGTKAVATSLIPFRGVVRFASGATNRDKKALDADKRGHERRGFLIGVGSANGCQGFKASGRLR